MSADIPVIRERGATRLTNLEQAMSAVPGALDAYRQLLTEFERSSFSPLERQLILYAASVANGCDYCCRWHDWLSRRAGLNADDARAVADGKAIGDARLEALRSFVVAMVESRGENAEVVIKPFLSQGWTRHHAVELLPGLAAKVLSNYASALLQPAPDRALLSLDPRL